MMIQAVCNLMPRAENMYGSDLTVNGHPIGFTHKKTL